MGKINYGRMVLCGIVTGLAWTLFSLILFTFLGRDFQEATPNFRSGAPSGGLIAIGFVLDLAIGIWGMWLYAAIRPRYGAGPKSAAIAGFSLWLVATIVDAHWLYMGFVQPAAALPLLVSTMPALVVSVLIGARFYEEVPPAATDDPHPRL